MSKKALQHRHVVFKYILFIRTYCAFFWVLRHCVERGDFSRAVKFLNHLKGAPRGVVSGWIQEACLVLQVRNATQVLKNYSTMLIQRSAVPV
jgi:hypothetical protein